MKKTKEVSAVLDAVDELALAQEPSKGRKIANTIINVILVLVIIIAAVATYTSYVSTSGNGVPSIFGVRIMSIQTESMYPTLSPGDMIFDTAVKDSSTLEIGDVITYWTVIDGERVLNTHRIIEIYDGGGYLIFETQGDNNTVADALTVHESEVVGQWKGAKIGGLGKVFDYLQTSTGFLIVIVIPVALFFIFHLIQFFRVLFEYNNVKNKLRYELERGKNEDIIDEERAEMEKTKKEERARLEAELREKLKAEILASSAPNAPSEEQEDEEEEESAEDMEARIRAEIAAKAEEEAKAKAEADAKAEEEAKAKAEADARAKMEAEIRAKVVAEMEAKAEEEAKAKAEEEARAKMEAEIRAKVIAEMEAKAQAEANDSTEPTEA